MKKLKTPILTTTIYASMSAVSSAASGIDAGTSFYNFDFTPKIPDIETWKLMSQL